MTQKQFATTLFPLFKKTEGRGPRNNFAVTGVFNVSDLGHCRPAYSTPE